VSCEKGNDKIVKELIDVFASNTVLNTFLIHVSIVKKYNGI
jgi:hypothetical protein